MDLLGTAFRRNRFDIHDPKVIGRMEPLVAALGNTLYASESQILMSTLKVVGAMIKLPLKSLPNAMPVFVRQILQILRTEGNTESEVSQAALRTLATVVRDSSTTSVQEKDLTFLLELCGPDIEETNRQSASFAVLKAIVSRKFVVPEIYDLMEKIAEVMITSQSPQTQELSRSVLLQFLLEYPQGKGRLKKLMLFLARNLSYAYESGRISVMEFVSAVIAKFNEELVQEYTDTFFVALVMALANEDSNKCRQIVVELIKSLLSKLGPEQREAVMTQLEAWSQQRETPTLTRVAFQVYTLVFDVFKKESNIFVVGFQERLTPLLEAACNGQAALEAAVENPMPLVDQMDWQSLYHGLCALEKLAHVTTAVTTLTDRKSSIITLLLYPHAWIRKSCCRLVGIIFGDPELSAGISDTDHFQIANKLCAQLKSHNLDSEHALQIVKNLFYIGKTFYESDRPEIDTTTAEIDVKEDEDEGDSLDDKPTESRLPWIFSKMSYQARSAYLARIQRPSHAVILSPIKLCRVLIMLRVLGMLPFPLQFVGLRRWPITWNPLVSKGFSFIYSTLSIESSTMTLRRTRRWVSGPKSQHPLVVTRAR